MNGLKKSDNTTFTYTTIGDSYCLGATSSSLPGKSFYVAGARAIQEGACPPALQTVTTVNCPDSRTRAVDARDGRTYWIQKLSDGQCWMLTNLAYAGGGSNTYGDVKSLTNGTGSPTTYTVASYYVHSSANPTTEPTDPLTSTDGGVTNSQYGYLYNWCGAMGGQATAACANATTPIPDANISVCPAGWRLPTGNGGDFGALNAAVNGGSTSSDSGLLSTWLGQYGGYWWSTGFAYQGSSGLYWSSSQETAAYAYDLTFGSSYVTPVGDSTGKAYGFAVRCIAA